MSVNSSLDIDFKYFGVSIDEKEREYCINPRYTKPNGPFSARGSLTKIHYILTNNLCPNEDSWKAEWSDPRESLKKAAERIYSNYTTKVESRLSFVKKIEVFFEKVLCKLLHRKTDAEIVRDLADRISKI